MRNLFHFSPGKILSSAKHSFEDLKYPLLRVGSKERAKLFLSGNTMSGEIPKLIRRSPVIRVDVELKSDVGNAIQRLGGFEFIGILVKNARCVSYTVQFFETGEGKWDTSISTNRIGCFIRAQAGKLISL